MEITAEDLSSYLSGRLDDGDAEDLVVSDITEHTEGWSRDTVSFTASWENEERRLVVRAESEQQATEDGGFEGNDIETEFRTMEATQDADVPVPETYWYEGDESVLGNRFFVVEHLEGDAPVTWQKGEREKLYEAWDSDSSLPEDFVDAAAGVHEIGPEDVPFLDQTPPDEVVETEIDRWESVYRESALKEEPAVNEALRWFRNNPPEVPETTLVHGDFRVGNMLIDHQKDEITGVLDWELARVGDPLYDLGYASTLYFAGKLINPIERPELACSLLERDWFYDEYEKRTGRDVDRERVRYWRAFSAFVMMTIGLAGVHRYDAGKTDDVRSAWFQYIVPGLIEDTLDIIREERV